MPAIDPLHYRQVLGQYPTGVCVVTGQAGDGSPASMVVGSFTSVSLDPPLVAFFPDKGSSSWAKLRGCEHFCINILSAEQELVCRRLASKEPDKFSGVAHCLSERGDPIVNGTIAWIDCDLHAISDAGDHDMVLGHVVRLEVGTGALPLLFFQGGYGHFAPASLAAFEKSGLSLSQLRLVDLARPAMERLSQSLSGRCIATAPIGDGLAVAASAGQARRGGTSTLVGQRLPFAPPTSAIFKAWSGATEIDRWLAQASRADSREAARTAVATVRERGYSIGLLSEAQRTFSARLEALGEGAGHGPELDELLDGLIYDPVVLDEDILAAIRLISAPVFAPSGEVVLALTLFDFGKPTAKGGIRNYIAKAVRTAADVTTILGGKRPAASTAPR